MTCVWSDARLVRMTAMIRLNNFGLCPPQLASSGEDSGSVFVALSYFCVDLDSFHQLLLFNPKTNVDSITLGLDRTGHSQCKHQHF